MADYGLDVSNHNAVNDWPAVRGNGITYAYLKTSEGTDFIDWRTAEHNVGARNAGIVTGGYHFARPGNIGGQVALFADQLAAHRLADPGSLWPALDMEADGFGDPNGFVAEFIGQLRERTGIRGVVVYANLDWFRNRLRPNEWCDGDVLLWLAVYNGEPGNTGGYQHPRLAIHQHTSSGLVPGIPGNVDRNITVNGHTTGSITIGIQENDMQLTDVVGHRPDGTAISVGEALANLYLGAYYGGGDAGTRAVYPTVNAINNDLGKVYDRTQSETAGAALAEILESVRQLKADVAALKAAK